MQQIRPTLAEFKRLARRGNLIPISIDVLADQVTPVSLLTHNWDKTPHCFLLESVEGGEKLGRYSIVGFAPDAVVEERAGESVFSDTKGRPFMRAPGSAMDLLKSYMNCVKPVRVDGLPRFYGGAVGYASYETVHHLERLPDEKNDALKWPTACFYIANSLFVFDNTQQKLKLISMARIAGKNDVTKAYDRARAGLNANLNLLKKAAFGQQPRKTVKSKKATGFFKSNMDEAAYIRAVKKAKEHIAAGDIIQVVIARRSEKLTTSSPLEIYRSLRVVNPSPYMYLFKMKDRVIIGSSPESLIRLEDGMAMTRPIAGTRRRGISAAQDEIIKKDLLSDPKERAEHLMLVDLARNDLGRVCDFGTVHVPIFMTIEKYSHVMHIVSEVQGRLKKRKDAFDLFRATFPAGTVSGAPKIRAMEIINDLESDQRGPYAGAFGYISYGGAMDMAITIRTILWDKSRVSLQTGAGLVADSDPRSEYQETENKAAAMKSTIEMAESGTLFLERL